MSAQIYGYIGYILSRLDIFKKLFPNSTNISVNKIIENTDVNSAGLSGLYSDFQNTTLTKSINMFFLEIRRREQNSIQLEPIVEKTWNDTIGAIIFNARLDDDENNYKFFKKNTYPPKLLCQLVVVYGENNNGNIQITMKPHTKLKINNVEQNNITDYLDDYFKINKDGNDVDGKCIYNCPEILFIAVNNNNNSFGYPNKLDLSQYLYYTGDKTIVKQFYHTEYKLYALFNQNKLIINNSFPETTNSSDNYIACYLNTVVPIPDISKTSSTPTPAQANKDCQYSQCLNNAIAGNIYCNLHLNIPPQQTTKHPQQASQSHSSSTTASITVNGKLRTIHKTSSARNSGNICPVCGTSICRSRIFTGSSVVLFNSNRQFILGKERFGKLKDQYNLPGGNLEGTTCVVDNAVREIIEEVKIIMKISDVVNHSWYHIHDSSGFVTAIFYVCARNIDVVMVNHIMQKHNHGNVGKAYQEMGNAILVNSMPSNISSYANSMVPILNAVPNNISPINITYI
jgi:ADP-ribose pyrophosphatase YjhB (NUDIX family)